jgi:uncharacterized protein (UPF0332 family)
VKAETAAFLHKAREFLAKSRNLLDAVHYPDEARRAAYPTGLHAAQALIFERTNRVIRRHRGVHNELRRPTKDDRASTRN